MTLPGLSPPPCPFSSYAFSLVDLIQFHDSQIQPLTLMSSLGCLIGILFSFTELLIALLHTKLFLLFFTTAMITTPFIQWLKQKLCRNLRFLPFSHPSQLIHQQVLLFPPPKYLLDPNISSSHLLLPTLTKPSPFSPELCKDLLAHLIPSMLALLQSILLIGF